MVDVLEAPPLELDFGRLPADVLSEAVPASLCGGATALRERPDLRRANAEVDRSLAEVDEMRAMRWPMALVRAGLAYTLSEGAGPIRPRG